MAATYTYDLASNPRVSYIRLLIPDTQILPNVDPPQMIFSDQEIEAFYQIQQGTFQSGMFFSGVQGRYLPDPPVSLFRVAAIALDTLANNKGKLGNLVKVLDVTLDWKSAGALLRDGAKNYREIDDNSGAFAIIENTATDWSFADRWLKQWQRQQMGAGFSS